MKNFKLLLVLLPAIYFTACNDDDDATPQQTTTGKWSLVNVSSGFTGIDDDFVPGTIAWTFNNDGTIDVVNNNTDTAKTDFFETGSYDYDFTANEDTPEMCPEVMMIEQMNFGCQAITGNQMVLTQEWADGYTVTLQKQAL